ITEEDLKKIIGDDNIIHKAYTALNQFHWTDEELRAYEAMKRERMDQKAILEYKIDEGKAIGKVEGRIEGEAIGLEKGRIEGIEKEKMQTAKRLLQAGCGIDLIVQATDLPREQIEDLKKYILEEPSAVNF
ncbi:MAG: hypothetical protein WBD50_02335, partial [Candidatus Rhabdochlamydia sp.]